MLFQLKAWVAFALTSALLANTVMAIPVDPPASAKGKTNMLHTESELINVLYFEGEGMY